MTAGQHSATVPSPFLYVANRLGSRHLTEKPAEIAAEGAGDLDKPAAGSVTVSRTEPANYDSIMSAVRDTEPGALIVVLPGLYEESVTVDKRVEIVGGGPAGAVVLTAADASCLTLDTASAIVRGITIRQRPGTKLAAVYAASGEPELAECDISSDAGAGVEIANGANPLIRRCRIHDGRDAGIYVSGNGRGTIEECDISGHEHANVEIAQEGSPIIRRCRIFDGFNAGLYVYDDGRVILEQCELYGHRMAQVAIADRGNPLVKGGVIRDGLDAGVFVVAGGGGTFEDCEIYGHHTAGIAVKRTSGISVRRCIIREGRRDGIYVSEGGRIALESCSIFGHGGIGLRVDNGEAVISGCRIDDEVSVRQSGQPAGNEQTYASDASEASDESGDFPELAPMLAKLDSFIGLDQVKRSIRDLIGYIRYVRERRRLGVKTAGTVSLHSIFLGNPGTGKTTIARLLGSLYRAMGLLEKGHVVEVDRAGLVAEYVGQTAIKTEKAVTEALGGVLFIDEAYTLAKGEGASDYGREAIEIILKRMEDHAGRFVVIAAGYPEEMQHFLEANPGLKDRFKHVLHFHDYAPEQLVDIAEHMAAKEEYRFSTEAVSLLRSEFTRLYRSRDKFFGNARLVHKCIEKMKLLHARRCSAMPPEFRTRESLTVLLPEEVRGTFAIESPASVRIPVDERRVKELTARLDRMIGLEGVKRSVTELIKLVRYDREIGGDGSMPILSHLLFLGGPGTGKTTVARLVSEFYSAFGVLERGHLVEVSREQLVGPRIGDTERLTTSAIDRAIGGVLFIDEAYGLTAGGGNRDCGQSAVDIVTNRMEKERGRLVVIAAGYSEGMRDFLDSNPGLRSRFGTRFDFADYTPGELIRISETMLADHGYLLSEQAACRLRDCYEQAYRDKSLHFGNGRLARSMVEEAVKSVMLRLADLPAERRANKFAKVVLGGDIRPLR